MARAGRVGAHYHGAVSVPPAITDDGWGRVVVEGRTFKDAKLWPGGARAWDWTETGTSHDTGVRSGDVSELLAHGVTHVVLSSGRQRRLAIHSETTALLDSRGVTYEVLPTAKAIARYEQLRAAGVAVGALLHTTC